MYVQYTNPAAYPPLEHSSRILADAGWEVQFLGTGAYGASPLRFPPHDRIRVMQMPFYPGGWRQKLDYIWYSIIAIAWILRWRPKWVYASDQLSTPPGLVATLIPGTRVIYHEHDSPAGPGRGPFAKMCFWATGELARRAVACVLPNEARLERFVLETKSPTRPFCIWNCPSRSDVGPPRTRQQNGDFWLLYHGSIVPARLPLSVIKALALLPPIVKLRVIGYPTVGRPGYIGELKDLAAELGLASRIEFIGPRSRHDLVTLCRQNDAGLSFMPMNSADVNLANMVGASNKPFDYLAAGLGLLVSKLPDWEDLYVRQGYARECDPGDPESIATAVRYFLDNPTALREMSERGRQKILSEWNYETQFEPVFQLLQST